MGPSPSCESCVNQKPTPETCRSLAWHTWDQVTPGQTWPPQKHPPLSEPCGNLVSERGKCVNNRLSFLKVMAIQRRLFFYFLCNNEKKVWFLLLYISQSTRVDSERGPIQFPTALFAMGDMIQL